MRRGGHSPDDDHEQPEDEDTSERAFRRAMADVVPLEQDSKRHVAAAPRTLPPRRGQAPAPGRPSDPSDDESRDFAAPGIDRRELRRLRRGDYPVQGRLDLHGMTVREAGSAIHRFIQNSRHSQHRCVCIVHGRGLHSEKRASALRGPVRDALKKTSGVLAFARAPSKDGGDGAVYVLLRRS